MLSEAIKIASAIDKSKPEPLLGNHAGDSETVTFRYGVYGYLAQK